MKINNVSYTTYETAIAAVYNQLLQHPTVTISGSSSWCTNAQTIAANTVSVVKVNGNANVPTLRTVNGTLVIVGDGTLTFNDANGGIYLGIGNSSLFLQGNVVLDGGGVACARQNALTGGIGKIYMADNATIRNCVNNYGGYDIAYMGGAIDIGDPTAGLYMAGGLIGDENVTMIPTVMQPMYEGFEQYEDCAWEYEIRSSTNPQNAANGNRAKWGGGVCLCYNCEAFINGGRICGNNATNTNGSIGGGGIFISQSQVTINGGKISHNIGISGGGIYSQESSLTINGGEFEWNCACKHSYNNYEGKNCGGAVYLSASDAEVNGGVFRQNRSAIGAAAIHFNTNGSTGRFLTIEDVEVCYNYGANAIVMEAGDALIKGGRFHDNYNTSGAIQCFPLVGDGREHTTTIGYVDPNTGERKGPEIYNNKATFRGTNFSQMTFTPEELGGMLSYCGGGITLNQLSLKLVGGKIYGNESDLAAGGIAVYNGNCTIEGGEITGNKALGRFDLKEILGYDMQGDGGGVYVLYDAESAYLPGNKKTVISGDALIKNNQAERNGGGLFVNDCEVDITGGTFDGNKANGTVGASTGSGSDGTGNGGGMYVKSDTETDMTGGTLINNVAANNGGGLYLKGAFDMDGGSLGTSASNGNIATAHDGGGVYVESGGIEVSSGTFAGNKAENGNGGGFYVRAGNVTLEKGIASGASINISNGNTAKNGGGIYVNGGSITIKSAGIENNVATVNGGGVYSGGGTFTITQATISGNQANNGNGGGFYSASPITIGNATQGTGSTISGNTAKLGGGFYVDNETSDPTTIQGGSTISGNTATQDGAGAYIAKGNLDVKTSDVYGNEAARFGGGFYVNGGTVNLTGGSIGDSGEGKDNRAVKGGGVFMNCGTANISNGNVQYNTANYGAGFYLQGADDTHTANADFSGGYIRYNTAEFDGGGFYLSANSQFAISGSAQVVNNSCTQGNGGGGIIKGGTMTVDGAHESSTFTVTDNAAAGIRNNLYLEGEDDYVTVLGTDEMKGNCEVGISINGRHLPKKVIHSDDLKLMQDLYSKLKDHSSRIFDDKELYEVVYSNTAPFSNDYIYFISTWKSYVEDEDWNGYDFYNVHKISDQIQLAQFMMLVNGIAKFPADIDMNKVNYDGIITADLDMGESLWIPIGEYHVENYPSSVPPFKGTLDGGGHVISNLRTEGLTSYEYYGLVGKSRGASVKNIVMSDCHLVSGEAKRMGAIIADMEGGVIDNCVASGTIDMSGSETMGPDSYEYCAMGGLVGEARGNAKLYNCMAGVDLIALPKLDMTTYKDGQKFTVGGLAGIVRSGSKIKNAYANVTIQHGGDNRGTADNTVLSRPVGGLAGSNAGSIENCYVRIDRPGTKLDQIVSGGAIVTAEQETASLFGMFAGNNTGSVTNCYAPDERLFALNRKYVQAGNVPSIYGDYAPAITPYYYKHDDNKVTMKNGTVDGANLLAKLNAWVVENNLLSGSKDDEYTPTYSTWMRTSASPINADYPLLTFDDLDEEHQYTTVGSHDGVDFEYSKSLQNIINSFNGTSNTGSGCLYVYKTPGENTSEGFKAEQISVANNTNVALYIQEKVALRNDVALPNTYTGITLDNSAGVNGANPYAGGTDAIDWHMFATPLDDAPLGIEYADEISHPFTWDAQANPLCFFYDEATEDGYFPSKTFGTTDPETGSYYHDWDFYTYDEPSYHWINFKRNKKSHWHEDVGYGVDPSIPENHEQINYTGTEYDSGLQRGKGYLLAAKNSTFLQSHGTLKTGDLVDYTLTASASEETGCKGYNLIGNPYQSYLDFDEFASTNNDGIEKEDKITSYIILDEDAKGYVSYAVGGSANYYPSAEGDGPAKGYKAPTNLINMHQGFFVVTNSDKTVQFKRSMCRFTADEYTHFRGADRPAYPLVNLVVTEENGNRDYLTVELDRPDTGGAVKLKGLRMGTSRIYTHCGDEDYAIAFMPCGTTSVPVRFETTEAGTFSLAWNTCNGTFSYLHLIDNMTGVDIDCLASDGYRFTASPMDYASRFRLVFNYTGIEENEAASTSSASFAFMHDGNLIVNGKGMLEVVDMNGRTVASKRLGDAQNMVGLPQMAQGVYVLKLTGDNVKVQKIVIE